MYDSETNLIRTFAITLLPNPSQGIAMAWENYNGTYVAIKGQIFVECAVNEYVSSDHNSCINCPNGTIVDILNV